MAKHLEDELHLAAINMDKLATKGTKKRRRSADSNQLLGKFSQDDSDSDEVQNDPLRRKTFDEDQMIKIEPLIDPFTGVKIFDIASHNLYDASILSRGA